MTSGARVFLAIRQAVAAFERETGEAPIQITVTARQYECLCIEMRMPTSGYLSVDGVVIRPATPPRA